MIYKCKLCIGINTKERGQSMKRKLRKPVARKMKAMLYSFKECSQSGTFTSCGLRW